MVGAPGSQKPLLFVGTPKLWVTGRNARPSVSVSRHCDEYIVRCAITLAWDRT